MAVRVKVSKKYQITVPSEIRRRLGVKSGDELLIEVRGGYMVLMPEPRDFSTRLRGLHREVWDGIDAQDFVRRERESWQS
jgi:AbrB family looped-hinge helix DNA binding protein